MKPKYRISRDRAVPWRWAVQVKKWWWPFWTEEVGLLSSRNEALTLIEVLKKIY